MRGKLAKVDQERAAFFPALKLTGSLGSSSSALSSLVQNPLLSLGASLSLPFLEWRKQGLQLKTSQADYELETVSFRKTLYGAYQEVDNALSARQRLLQVVQLQTATLALNRRSEQLAESRYRAGAVDAQTWLDAAKARRGSESALLRLRQEQLKNLADLYKALRRAGGLSGEGVDRVYPGAGLRACSKSREQGRDKATTSEKAECTSGT